MDVESTYYNYTVCSSLIKFRRLLSVIKVSHLEEVYVGYRATY